MNKTLLERQPNNKRIATTESLQKRFFNGSKKPCNGNRKTNAPSFRDKETHKIRINNVFP